jgi:sodium/bile acid cotransporter 7
LGLIVLPLMIFHQMQLMACAALARHYARTSLPAFEPARRHTFTVEAR